MAQLEKRQTNLARADEMTVDDVLAQVNKIQQLMRLAMIENQHYGVIPGTPKPTLLKAGAEKLCLTFRLAPKYEILSSVEGDKLVSFTVRCAVVHIPTDMEWGEGIGACNSRENKYRWRYTIADPQPTFNEQTDLKAQGKGKRQKIDGKWIWMEKTENDNAFEYANTVLKMAAKRALVAAVLNSTAASDIFTQDLEDGASNGPQAAPRATGDQVEIIKGVIRDLGPQAPDLWGEEVLLKNIRVKFGVDTIEELSEQQATMVIDGAVAWAGANVKDDEPVEGDVIEAVLEEDTNDNLPPEPPSADDLPDDSLGIE